MPKIAATWTGTLTTPQRNQLATFVGGLAPDATAIRGVSFWRNADNSVSWSLSGEKAIAALADLPTGVPVEIVEKT